MKTDIMKKEFQWVSVRIKSFLFCKRFSALLFNETISTTHYVETWNLISTLEFIVKSTQQKKSASIFRSQELYSKRVAKYLLRKLSSAMKCVIASKA